VGIIRKDFAMNSRLVFLVPLLILVAGPATAQIDPWPDGVGIYFDESGNDPCEDVPVGLVTTYLIVTKPTVLTGVSGWECRITYDGPISILAYTMRGLCINVLEPPQFMVGMGIPHPYSPAIVLMDLTIYVSDITLEGRIFVHPTFNPSMVVAGEGVPCYAAGDDPAHLIPLQIIMGFDNSGDERPVCYLNKEHGSCNTIPTVTRTWGGVKALYD
jgi:hypothetical protein